MHPLPRLFGAAALLVAGAAHGQPTYADLGATNLPQASLSDRSMDVELGDADRDGDLDVFVAKEFAPNLLLLNDGSFRFTVAVGAIPARNEDSEDVVLGDFDRDGDLDVVFTSEDTAVNEYYLNDGTGRFAEAPTALPQATQSNSGLASDLDGDGDLDLVLASNVGPEIVLLNDGHGVFTDVTTAWMPAIVDVTQDVELADVDRDGDLDLLTANEPQNGARNRLYLRDGARFVDATAARIPVSPIREETREVAYGDVDGDGDTDLVYGNVDFQNPAVAPDRLLLNDGRGFFTDASDRLPGPALGTLDVDLVDADGDGDLDVLAANFGTGLQVLRNDGTGRFADATAALLGTSQSARNVIDVELVAAAGALFIYEAGFNAPDRLLRRTLAATASFQPALSGAWFNPAQAGHGFNLYVLDAAVVLSWFTYDSDGRSMFVTAQGPRPAAGHPTAVLAASRGSGMPFRTFDRGAYRLDPWGTIRWTVVDCNRAVVEYESIVPAADGLPFGTGRIELQRLVAVPGLACAG